VLNRSGIVPIIDEFVSTTMPEHVGMNSYQYGSTAYEIQQPSLGYLVQ
jgi:hypothetical protein